ncbi:MAG: hypothetical protein IKT79_02885 [Akkermansia sp.]|nr:hypothetical protein [Akkermansia sp.]
MDRASVYNAALSMLGDYEYRERAGTQHPCDRWYPLVLRQANARYNWSFAAAQKQLTPIRSNAEHSVFEYPKDCLTYTRIINLDTGRRADNPRRLGPFIYTEPCSAILITYTSNRLASMQYLPDDMPEYCLGVIELLAARIAPVITGNPSLSSQFESLAEQHFMQAITRDAQQLASNKQNPLISILERDIYA